MWSTGGAYNDWAQFLTRWAQGENPDPAGLPAIHPDDFSADTWQRLADRLWDAFDGRLRQWSVILSRELSSGADEFMAGRALTQARDGLRKIRALANSQQLPEDLRRRFLEEIDKQVGAAQSDLDRSVNALRAQGLDPRLVEARRRTIKENPLTVVLHQTTDTAPSAASGWYLDPADSPRRRVIRPD